MEYCLKDKIVVTKDFLNDLETKSWQEIEHLQNQIANIEANKESAPLLKLLNNLLTSYYVFTGGLENLSGGGLEVAFANDDKDLTQATTANETIDEPDDSDTVQAVEDTKFTTMLGTTDAKTADFEPFEYFVDFDEPSGEALTDEDLYNL